MDRIFGAYSMETILATCFGRVVAIQKGEQDHLTEIAETIFSNVQEGKKFSTFFFMTLLSKLPHNLNTTPPVPPAIVITRQLTLVRNCDPVFLDKR